MQTCIAWSTDDTVACWLEWHAAPADAASSSRSENSSSEARSPLMPMLSVFGSRNSEHVGPFTLATPCAVGTSKGLAGSWDICTAVEPGRDAGGECCGGLCGRGARGGGGCMGGGKGRAGVSGSAVGAG